MAFPTSPTNGQIAVVNGIRYSYNTTTHSWTRIVSAKYTVSTTPPTTAFNGDQWYNSSTDILYEYINDGVTSYWVDIISLGQTGNITTIVDSTLTGNIVVGLSNVYSIGASTGYVKNIYANLLTANTITVNGNILPSTNVIYNLGSTTQRFKDLWLSGSTIYLGGASLSTDGANVTISNPQGGSFNISGNSNNSANVTFGNVITNGNITSANITASGNIQAAYVHGNGSKLTNLNAASTGKAIAMAIVFGG
jgi:hypothetical protein